MKRHIPDEAKSQERETERYADKTGERYQHIFEHISSGVAVYRALDGGSDFQFLEFNTAAEKITRVSRHEVLGKRLLEKFPGMKKFGLLDALRRVWETGVPEDMPPRYYEDSVRRGWRQNHIYRLPTGEVVALFNDVTEQVEREVELANARDRAEKASSIKSAFITNMSHELRTPLNGIEGMLQLLLHTTLTEEQRKYIETAMTTSEALVNLISDLLYISRLERNESPLTEATFSLRKFLDELNSMIEKDIQEKGLHYSCSISESVPELLFGDRQRIWRIIYSIVQNAVKFTENGKIIVEISAKYNNIDNDGKPTLHVVVRDTGVGIPEKMTEFIQQPFTQLDASMRRRFQGAGLGLYLVRRLVDSMEGTLSIQSSENCGTTVHVSVPFEGTGENRRDIDMSDTARKKGALNILVAEDNRTSSLFLQKLLEKHNHHVTCVENGLLALEALDQDSFDMILMDIQMPELDGLEATRMIRHRGLTLPVIAITAHARDEDRQQCLDAGMNDFITKPVQAPALLACIDALRS